MIYLVTKLSMFHVRIYTWHTIHMWYVVCKLIQKLYSWRHVSSICSLCFSYILSLIFNVAGFDSLLLARRCARLFCYSYIEVIHVFRRRSSLIPCISKSHLLWDPYGLRRCYIEDKTKFKILGFSGTRPNILFRWASSSTVKS